MESALRTLKSRRTVPPALNLPESPSSRTPSPSSSPASSSSHSSSSPPLPPPSPATLSKSPFSRSRKAPESHGRVVVSARVRPFLASEKKDRQPVILAEPDEKTITAWLQTSSRIPQTPQRTKRKSFCFDNVFAENSSQEDVFQIVGSPLIDAVLNGVNGCLIAYGQTGAGKTYTTFGAVAPATEIQQEEWKEKESWGLIPRSVAAMFEALEARVKTSRGERRRGSESKGRQEATVRYSFAVYVTYYQIYLDSHIQDLLNPTRHDLQIRMMDEEGDSKHRVDGLSEHRVMSVADVLELLRRGDANKVTSQTSMNEKSSRSHSIFSIQLVQYSSRVASRDSPISAMSTGAEATYTVRSKLTCVDLAGSERASKTQPKGLQLEEAKSINRSLSALGNVIAALSLGAQHRLTSPSSRRSREHHGGGEKGFESTQDTVFVPWRDSKLTRVLQDSLSGNAKVSLIINIGPSASNAKESVNSMLFGRRSMQVSLEPQMNVQVNYEELCKELEASLQMAEQSYRRRLAHIEHLLAEKTREIEQLREENKPFNKNSRSSEQGNNSNLVSSLEQLRSELAEQQKKYEILSETQALLEEALLEQVEISTATEKKLQAKHDENQRLLETLHKLTDMEKKLKEEILRLRDEVRGEKLRAEADRQNLDERALQLDSQRDVIQELQDRIKTYESLLVEKEEDSSQSNERLRMTIEELRAKHNAEVSSLKRHLDQARTERDDLVLIREKLQEQLSHRIRSSQEEQTKEKLAASEDQVKKLKARLRAMKKELDASQKRSASLSQVVAQHEKRQSGLENKLRMERETSAQYKQSAEEWETCCEELRSKAKQLEENVRQDQNKDEQIGELQADNSRLRQENDSATTKAAETLRENQLLRKDIERISGLLESAENKMHSMVQLQEQERSLYEALLAETKRAGAVGRTAPLHSRRATGQQAFRSTRSLLSSPQSAPLRLQIPHSNVIYAHQQSITAIEEHQREGLSDTMTGLSDSDQDNKTIQEADEYYLGRDDTQSVGRERMSSQEEAEAELLSSPRLQQALARSKQALARAMEAINEV